MALTANIGEIVECGANDDVRTRGCDPCVALIVIYGEPSKITKKCAHFSVSIKGPPVKEKVLKALDPVLTNEFPLKGVKAAGYAWGGANKRLGAEIIAERLAQYFKDVKDLVQVANRDSLSTKGTAIVASNDKWPWTNDPPRNQLADLK